MDIWSALFEWNNSDVFGRIVLSFALAAIWTTVAVGFVHFRWQADAEKLATLWLMSTFGFTLMNLAVLLVVIRWPFNTIVDAAALALVPIAYFRYGMHIKTTERQVDDRVS